MIEPTETESKQTLDEFVAAMRAIVTEARETPDVVKEAPHAHLRRPPRRDSRRPPSRAALAPADERRRRIAG